MCRENRFVFLLSFCDSIEQIFYMKCKQTGIRINKSFTFIQNEKGIRNRRRI